MTNKPVAIFRTKEQMMRAEELGNIKILDKVLLSQDFRKAGMKDVLGFKVLEGSDYTAIEVKSVKDNPSAFMEFAFGEVASGGKF